jgi:hypothetical protein
MDIFRTQLAVYRQPFFPWQARLVHCERIPSTQFYFTDSFTITPGIAIGAYTGNTEQFITLWDCGRYGLLASDKEKVYRLAQFETILLLQSYDGLTIIKDIKDEMMLPEPDSE